MDSDVPDDTKVAHFFEVFSIFCIAFIFIKLLLVLSARESPLEICFQDWPSEFFP